MVLLLASAPSFLPSHHPCCLAPAQLPFFYDAVNHLWVGLWCGIVFTCCMLVAITYTVNKRPAALQLTYREDMTFVSTAAAAGQRCRLMCRVRSCQETCICHRCSCAVPCCCGPAGAQAVLYGIFPAVLLGALLSAAWMRWRRRPLAELAAAFAAQASSSAVNLKDVHRFRDSVEVHTHTRKRASDACLDVLAQRACAPPCQHGCWWPLLLHRPSS